MDFQRPTLADSEYLGDSENSLLHRALGRSESTKSEYATRLNMAKSTKTGVNEKTKFPSPMDIAVVSRESVLVEEEKKSVESPAENLDNSENSFLSVLSALVRKEKHLIYQLPLNKWTKTDTKEETSTSPTSTVPLSTALSRESTYVSVGEIRTNVGTEIASRPGAYHIAGLNSGADESETSCNPAHDLSQSRSGAASENQDDSSVMGLTAIVVDEEIERQILEKANRESALLESIEKSTLEAQAVKVRFRRAVKAGILAALIALATSISTTLVMLRRNYDPEEPQSVISSEVASWVQFVNQISLSNFTFSYPISSSNPTAGEIAMDWFVVNREMSHEIDKKKAAQRFAFVFLAFAWNVTDWTIEKGFDECLFTGVVCDTNGTALALYLGNMGFSQEPIIEGGIPNDLGLLSWLEEVTLSGNKLRGTVPWEVIMSSMTKLIYIDMRNNLLSGQLPSIQPNSEPKLETLLVERNLFQGTISPNLAHWTALKYFQAGTNKLSGTIPTELSLLPMEEFGVQDNYLLGSIPTEFGRWSMLNFFDVHSNQEMTGTIPTEVGLWTNINYFSCDGNSFNGTLPTEIERWSSLITFNAAANNFSGSFPSGIEKWTNLIDLYIHDNVFTGQFPVRFAQPALLANFWVGNNTFKGVIPGDQLANWSGLISAAFEGNNITGSLEMLCNATGEYATITADCSEVKCPCCANCS